MLRDPILTAASPTRLIPRVGGDPVTVAVDAATADLVVFDLDGETVLTLPWWLNGIAPSHLDHLVVSLLRQLDARYRHGQQAGRAYLQCEFARLMNLPPAEQEAR